MINGQNNLNQSVYLYFFPEVFNVFDPDITNCRLYAPLNIALSSQFRNYRPIYMFDLYNFANITNNNELGEVFNDDITQIYNTWHPLLVSSLQHNSQEVYKRTSSIYPLNILTMPDPKAQKLEGSIKTNVLIPFSGDPLINTVPGLQALWRISVFPFVPFILASSVPSAVLSGPMMMKNFSISVENDGPVFIDMSFIGGKSLVSPVFTTYDVKQQAMASNIPWDTNIYRLAKMADCFYYLSNYGNLDSSVLQIQNQILTRDFQTYSFNFADKIIKIELKIIQDVEPDFVFTNTANLTQASGYSDIPQNIFGPKYLKLNSRDVTGAFTFFSYNEPIINYNELQDSLILYFGGPFYYPLEKIDFQINDLIIQQGESGWISRLSFIASVVNGSNVIPDNDNNYSSEFKIANFHLYEPLNSGVQANDN